MRIYMAKNIRLSVCIPAYDQQGMGAEFLAQSLNVLALQTFKDFEVVITDDSRDDNIKDLCKEYEDVLTIKYSKNKLRLGLSANTNKALSKATGDLIKVLFMDDYLYDKDALQSTVEAFRGNWLVSACEHSKDGINCNRPMLPYYNHSIHTGNNTISSPSVLTIKNEGKLLFNEGLIWLMDCEYYKRCYEKFGLPTILNKITVVNRISQYQTTSTLMEEVKMAEVRLMTEKYKC